MPEGWCTVTVTDVHRNRLGANVLATRTYGAPHLYLTHSKNQPQFPVSFSSNTRIFGIATGEITYAVTERELQRWIEERR